MREDKYGVIAEATRLISNIRVGEDCKREYEQADKDLTEFIGKQIKQVTGLTGLLELWSDSCKGAESLRRRFNFAETKDLIKSPAVAFDMLESLGDGVFRNSNVRGFSVLNPDDDLDISFYENYHGKAADKTSLMCTLLLDYLYGGDYAGLEYMRSVKSLISCDYTSQYIPNLAPMPKIRFWDFKLEDKEFIGLFATGLRDLIAKEADTVLGLKLKWTLTGLLTHIWSVHGGSDVYTIYAEIEKALLADKTKLGVSSVVNEISYTYHILITKVFEVRNVSYRVNVEALELLATMIRDLGLADIKENEVILNMIDNV